MSAFAVYVSSDSEEDEEQEKRAAESNRKAKLEMERLKANNRLTKRREEMKKAREKREAEARERRELKKQEEESARKTVQLNLTGEGRCLVEEKWKLREGIKNDLFAFEENEIIQQLVNAYVSDGDEADDEHIDETRRDNNIEITKRKVSSNDEIIYESNASGNNANVEVNSDVDMNEISFRMVDDGREDSHAVTY